MKDFAKIVKGVINPLIIFTKNSIMDGSQGTKYVYDTDSAWRKCEKQEKADFIQLSITYNCSIPEF